MNIKKTLLALGLMLGLGSNASAASAPESFAPLVEKLSPAVVNISTTQVVKGYEKELLVPYFPQGSGLEGFNKMLKPQVVQRPKTKTTSSLGSGFIIDSKGIIITNNHVVKGATDITVRLSDNTELKAKIIGRDTRVDLAVLKVESTKPLPFVSFGDSDKARVGDWVIAIGNPYGLGGSVSAGIISARSRDINVGPVDDFIQTDAAINRGNSGGPLFDVNGKVIGINTAIFSPTGSNVGIGFALPSSQAEPVIKQIIQYGKAKRAWLGVKVQEVTPDIAESLGLKSPKGALVLEVPANSPAAKIGLKEGDVITSFNNQPIEDMRSLPKIVASSQIGKQANIEFLQGGKLLSGKVTLGEYDEKAEIALAEEKKEAEDVTGTITKVISGMEMVELNSTIAARFGLKRNKGLLVSAIDNNSAAATSGIVAGSILVKAGDIELSKISTLEQLIVKLKKAGKKSVLLLVQADANARFIALPL
jgi:serine protease Do